MKAPKKEMDELKQEVLIAYLHYQAPGMPEETRLQWAERYEASRTALEQSITAHFSDPQKKDPSK